MKRLPIVWFLLAPVLILSANKLFAQSLFDRGVPLFEHAFSLYESGNTFTIAITQDQQGKIWIGGRYGLKFYTGQRFVDVKKVAGQHLAGVRSLYVDEQNSIWIGTPNQGVFVYPQEPDIEPRHYTTDNSELAGNYIRSISGDQNGRLWFATETGLSEFELQNNQFETIPLVGFPDSIEQTKVRDLSVANGVLWAGTEAGLGRYETSEIESKSLIFSGLASDTSAVDASGGEQIWLGQTDGQILVLDSKTGVFEKVDVGQLASLESVYRINDIKRVGDDEIWIITNRSGVIVINTDSYKRNYPTSNIRNFRIAHGTFVEGSFLEII